MSHLRRSICIQGWIICNHAAKKSNIYAVILIEQLFRFFLDIFVCDILIF